MTAAGIATAAFFAIIAVLYVGWTALAAQSSWGHTDRFEAIGAIATFLWLVVHVGLALIGLALLLEWLGIVAGWWQQ